MCKSYSIFLNMRLSLKIIPGDLVKEALVQELPLIGEQCSVPFYHLCFCIGTLSQTFLLETKSVTSNTHCIGMALFMTIRKPAMKKAMQPSLECMCMHRIGGKEAAGDQHHLTITKDLKR